jgi:hypothetical protein
MNRLVLDTPENRRRYARTINGRWMGWLSVERPPRLPSPDTVQMLDDLTEPDVRRYRRVRIKHGGQLVRWGGGGFAYPVESWVETYMEEEPLR